MTISDVYKKFVTPPNLQKHLLLVTHVAMYISQKFKDQNIDINKLRVAALLHDLANIVKFDFVKHPEFLGEEQPNINYWIDQQKQVIDQYGDDDHSATNKMLDEIGVSDEIKNIILSKAFGNATEVNNSQSWEAKILLYSDLRVGPFGMISLKERIDDIVSRLEKYRNRPDLPDLVSACQNIEKQILKITGINIEKLSESDLVINDDKLLNTPI